MDLTRPGGRGAHQVLVMVQGTTVDQVRNH